jgi:hypothetical protein
MTTATATHYEVRTHGDAWLGKEWAEDRTYKCETQDEVRSLYAQLQSAGIPFAAFIVYADGTTIQLR